LSTIKMISFLDKHFIMIAFNFKTNYENVILIVIQSSMPQNKYLKIKHN
jgi:hypothetical protein